MNTKEFLTSHQCTKKFVSKRHISAGKKQHNSFSKIIVNHVFETKPMTEFFEIIFFEKNLSCLKIHDF
jgi:hypothetical protein